jgi:MYXO-CTERM domain-containing protein
MLQTLLGSGYDVRNFGDCCASVIQGYTPAETHPYVLGALAGRGPGYNESFTFLPDIVVIGSWGRHDWGLNKAPSEKWSLAEFQKDYDDLVQRYMKLSSHPKIYASLPIPILFGQGDVPDNGVTTSSVLPAVRAVAAKYNLPVIDLYTPFLNHRELFKEEGEHVTDDTGLHTIAQAVYDALVGVHDGGVSDGASDSGTDDVTLIEIDGATELDSASSTGTPGGGGTGGGSQVGPQMPAENGRAGNGGGEAMATTSTPPGSTGCSCSTSPETSGAGGSLALLALGLAICRRQWAAPSSS